MFALSVKAPCKLLQLLYTVGTIIIKYSFFFLFLFLYLFLSLKLSVGLDRLWNYCSCDVTDQAQGSTSENQIFNEHRENFLF